MFIKYYIYRIFNKNLYRYLCYLAFLIVYTFFQAHHADNYILFHENDMSYGTLYYILDLFLGMKIYYAGIGIRFEIPYAWIINMVFILFISDNSYNESDSVLSSNTVIRSANRITIGLAILVGNIVNFLLVGMILTIMFIFMSIIRGVGIEESVTLINQMNEVDLLPLMNGKSLLDSLILIALGIFTIMLMQTTFSVLFDNKVSFIVMFIFTIAGAYIKSPFIVSNYCMILRHNQYCFEGMKVNECVLISIVYLIISFGVTIISTCKRDFCFGERQL